MIKKTGFGFYLLGFMLTVVLVFSTACGQTASQTTSSTAAAATTTIPTSTAAATPTTTAAVPTTTTATTAISTSAAPSTTTASTATSASTATTTASATATPLPTTSATTTAAPATLYQPAAAPYKPTGEELDLFRYALELINQDRAAQNLPPVELTYNAAAQKHARDMLQNNYLAHWDTDGLKPYMRYTQEGGLNYEKENSAYVTGNKKIDPKVKIKELEHTMVYDDASSNWGHRDNIWNKLHKKVSLGIAYDEFSLALVQQFEGDYVEYFMPPTITGSRLAMSGRFKMSGLTLNYAAVTYDPLPQPLSGAELSAGPYRSYGLGQTIGQVLPPPPPNAQYNNLPAGAIVADKGGVEGAAFQLEGDISSLMAQGAGVYTICLIAEIDGKMTNFSNYSVWVK